MNRTFAAAWLSAAILSGCGAPIILKYEPAAGASLPGTNTLRVLVTRPENAYGKVVVQGPGYKPGVGVSLEDAIGRGLSAEFAAAGFQLVDDRSVADAVVSSSVEEARVVWVGGVKTPVDATLRVVLTLKDRTGRGLWEGELRGNGRGFGGAVFIGSGPQDAMNAALASAMRKIVPLWSDGGVVARIRGEDSPRVARAPERVAAAPRSDLDDLPPARAESKRRHAVVIGVERYRENLPRADFAAADARLAAEYFKRVLGVPEQNLALLIDERAAKSDFEKYFERWLPNRVEAGDEVFIYFSGHGAPNPAKGDAYLVPYDGDPTYIDSTGYSLKRMYENLAKLPAKSVLVAMDSCFSGAGGRSVLAKGARPLVTVAVLDELPAKITVLAASAGDQISNTYQEKGHGLFTYFLLKGLKQKGADLKGVFEYLKPEVARFARRELNSDQDPQWRQGK